MSADTQDTNIQANKERFCQLLRATERENIDYVIEDLEALGFFTAPASVRNHFNFPGGLVQHSLNVYDAAMAVRRQMCELRPSLADELSEASIAIAALLHDVCKADLYTMVNRKRKNEIGMWEDVKEYQIGYENFPMGHGEKSVIMLLRSGLDLEDAEALAIRWHMGPWELNSASIDQDRNYRAAQAFSPLVPLIHTADTLAASLLERDAAH
ncbi:MAG: HD domain-containing protein [Muribaculaceae bacterium]|nr:HD domain-containing protein [Muribaculaceae bacterium]